MIDNDVVIKLKNVTKSYKMYKNDKDRLKAAFVKKVNYKEKLAINNVSFEIKKGESVALFGGNGAGKSTLLKMITGVVYPTSGTLTVNRRVSALLELGAGFDGELTGLENIYFRGEILGISKDEMERLEPEILEFAELGEYINQPLRTYSSGMKARLGFAINSSVRPEILIVDEALSVGDAKFREKCNDKVKEIVEAGVTFLFVTHSTASAKAFCKRGLVMKSGQLCFDGDIDDAISYYKTISAYNPRPNVYLKFLEESNREITEPLPAPDVQISLSSSGKPFLSWKRVIGAIKYEIWRREGEDGEFVKIFTVKYPGFTNVTVSPGLTYSYKVRAICAKNEFNSPMTEELTIVSE